MSKENQHKVYTDLAKWWPVFSPPSDDKEEVDDFLPGFIASSRIDPWKRDIFLAKKR